MPREEREERERGETCRQQNKGEICRTEEISDIRHHISASRGTRHSSQRQRSAAQPTTYLRKSLNRPLSMNPAPPSPFPLPSTPLPSTPLPCTTRSRCTPPAQADTHLSCARGLAFRFAPLPRCAGVSRGSLLVSRARGGGWSCVSVYVPGRLKYLRSGKRVYAGCTYLGWTGWDWRSLRRGRLHLRRGRWRCVLWSDIINACWDRHRVNSAVFKRVCLSCLRIFTACLPSSPERLHIAASSVTGLHDAPRHHPHLLSQNTVETNSPTNSGYISYPIHFTLPRNINSRER